MLIKVKEGYYPATIFDKKGNKHERFVFFNGKGFVVDSNLQVESVESVLVDLAKTMPNTIKIEK